MRAPKKAATYRSVAAKLRSWRVSVIRKHGQYLGTVKAPNAAEVAAMAEFDLSDEQRGRLIVQERV
jgi:translation initiation factor IF-3